MAYDFSTTLELDRYSSLVDLIEQASVRYGDKTAFVCLGQAVSFSEIDTWSRRFAAWLQHSPLQAGDRVAIQLPNLIQYVVAAYGVIRAGMVLVNTNPLYTERELVHQYNDAGAKALVVLSDLLPMLDGVLAKTDIEHVISTHAMDLIAPQDQPDTAFDKVEFCEVLRCGAKLPYQPVTVGLDDLVALQYTGGTTGLSKGAMLSHGNLLANVEQTRSRIGGALVEGEEIFVAPLPVYHIYAFMVNLALIYDYGGSSVLIPNPRDMEALVKTLAPCPFTGFAGLNTLFVGLCHQSEFQALDFSALKLTISGGTALTQAASDLWRRTTGCTIAEGAGGSRHSWRFRSDINRRCRCNPGLRDGNQNRGRHRGVCCGIR
jgi:long-chain acyl-CoA synthetase